MYLYLFNIPNIVINFLQNLQQYNWCMNLYCIQYKINKFNVLIPATRGSRDNCYTINNFSPEDQYGISDSGSDRTKAVNNDVFISMSLHLSVVFIAVWLGSDSQLNNPRRGKHPTPRLHDHLVSAAPHPLDLLQPVTVHVRRTHTPASSSLHTHFV